MRGSQRCDDFLLPFLWKDRLESQLGDALLTPGLAARWPRSFAAEEGSRSLCVPGTVLVVADASGARLEEGVAHRVESLARYEDDELAIQVSVSICAFCSLPL
jgi:hypothetical protein